MITLTPEQELKAYAHEIGAEYITVSTLISSHRWLRKLQQEEQKERQSRIKESLDRYELALKQQETITLQELSEMTQKEVSEMLRSYEDRHYAEN